MTSRFSRRHAALLPLLLLPAGACATGARSGMTDDAGLRPARDVPTAFTFETPASTAACQNPAVDPRDGTRLTLVRSGQGRGDYAVPGGRYGAGPAELLRLSCATGAIVGLVPR